MTSHTKKGISLGLTLLFFSFVHQWEFLQMGAWVTMIRDYSQESTFKQAVADTFSGQKPCGKCKELTQSKTGASKGSEITASSTLPPEIASPEISLLPDPPSGAYGIPLESVLFIQPLSSGPPVPPPRFFLG